MSNFTLKLYNHGTLSMGLILTMNTCHERKWKPPLLQVCLPQIYFINKYMLIKRNNHFLHIR
jgi:hypothetical protein